MSPVAGNGSSKPQTWSARLLGAFSGPAQRGSAGEPVDPGEILPPEKRKAAMRSLDATEVKWCSGAFGLAVVAGIAIPAYITATNKVTKHGKNSIAVAPDAWLLGGFILLLGILGLLALWRRKRTLVAFDLFLIGFGFTLFVGLAGFIFIFLGGWLMLRAWRLNKYGTTSARAIAKETTARPRGRDRKDASRSGTRTTKAGSGPQERKPPTASKRYTPKSPPRKKIPKATQ
jgi:hypothetical protein